MSWHGVWFLVVHLLGNHTVCKLRATQTYGVAVQSMVSRKSSMEESCLCMFRKHRGKFTENFWSVVEQGVRNCTRRNALRSIKRNIASALWRRANWRRWKRKLTRIHVDRSKLQSGYKDGLTISNVCFAVVRYLRDEVQTTSVVWNSMQTGFCYRYSSPWITL